jgi:putative sterol carrier protein
MATKERVTEIMGEFVEKVNEIGPMIAEGWGGKVQVIMSDLGIGWLVKFAKDGTVESWDEKIDEETADGVMECTSDVFVDIWEKRLPGMEALSEGKLATRKSLDALMKLAPVIL